MKIFLPIIIITGILLINGCTASAQPVLSDVQVQYAESTLGSRGAVISFTASEGGTLAVQLRSSDNSAAKDIGAIQIEAGTGQIEWDGYFSDGSLAESGEYTVVLCEKNYWGEESERSMISLKIEDDSEVERLDLSELTAEDVLLWDEISEDALSVDEGLSVSEEEKITDQIPKATSFWDMNPDEYDLNNADHQKAIWDLMMQPILVFDVGQTDHVYPTKTPGASRTPYEQNTTGELHGQSQGIHILEEDGDGDGYVLIEAYSNDGTKTNNKYMESLDNQLIRGYVKKQLIIEKKPSSKYALLIDKLRQKLYIFQEGKIIGNLDVSSGLNNAKQPYNESPAGEFITVSKVGEFISGTMRAQYAIRINGGTLLHEVPYRYMADGTTKNYTEFEKELGKKASHGCIRIQRRKNAEGQNMLWLWENLEAQTRVFIWDDQGRKMYSPEPPESALVLYRNPNGGSNYHLDMNCSGVKSKFLPLTGDFTYGDLMSENFRKLTPCVYCGAPARPETLYERYVAEAKQIGVSIDEAAVKEAFGI